MVRMKRFYLMLCFLMSIIGSAWGQETKESSFDLGAITSGNGVNLAGADGLILNVSYDTEISENKSYFVSDGRGYRCFAGATFKFTIPSNVIVTSIKYVSNKNGNSVEKLGEVTITENENWTPFTVGKAEYYLWEGSLNSDTEFQIQKGSGDGNVYISSIVVTYTKTLTPTDNTIDVVDLNYIDGCSAGNGLDRALPDFILKFEGGDGSKYNSPSMQIRYASGKMIVGLTDDNIAAGAKMTKIVFAGTVTTGLTASVGTIDAANGTWTSAEGVTEVTFASTTSDAADLTFTSMVITTNDTPKNIGNKITPVFTLASDNISAVLDPDNREVNSPALTTTPSTFAVEYYIEEDLYDTGTAIDKTTGLITMGTKSGEVKFKVNYNGKKNVDGSWKSNN